MHDARTPQERGMPRCDVVVSWLPRATAAKCHCSCLSVGPRQHLRSPDKTSGVPAKLTQAATGPKRDALAAEELFRPAERTGYGVGHLE
jgi:hypothetical protein